MLLNEIFQPFINADAKDQSSNPVLNIPLKFILVTPEHMAELTPRKNKQAGVLASQLKKGQIKDMPPVEVKKDGKGFILTRGLLRFLAYQRARMYSIPARIALDTVVAEDRERYIIYMNGKPTAYYASKLEANAQADYVRKKQPNAKIEVKMGTVS